MKPAALGDDRVERHPARHLGLKRGPRDGQVAGPGEQPLSADERPKPQLVEEVVLAVEQWLQRRRKTLPPAKKARLMRLLYEHFLAKGEVEPDHVNEMLLLAA